MVTFKNVTIIAVLSYFSYLVVTVYQLYNPYILGKKSDAYLITEAWEYPLLDPANFSTFILF